MGSGTTAAGTGSGPTQQPSRTADRRLVAAGSAALVPAVVLAFLRLVPPSDDATALVASFIPYGGVFALVAVVCLGAALLRTRSRPALGVATLTALVVLAGHVVWQAPLFVAEERPAAGPGLTLLSLNTYRGLAEPDQVVTAAAGADLVVLVEATPEFITALDQRGWRLRFPYTAGASSEAVLGEAVTDTVIFSRYPLRASEQIGEGLFEQWVTTVAVPQLGELRLASVHPCNPYCGDGRWAAEHARLEQSLRQDLDLDRPLVVAGDFNAVDDHGPMLGLRALGLRSATDLLGAGWLPTYPANRVVPPLLAIDHVLVNDRLTTTSLHRVAVDGTDHLGLLVSVAAAR